MGRPLAPLIVSVILYPLLVGFDTGALIHYLIALSTTPALQPFSFICHDCFLLPVSHPLCPYLTSHSNSHPSRYRGGDYKVLLIPSHIFGASNRMNPSSGAGYGHAAPYSASGYNAAETTPSTLNPHAHLSPPTTPATNVEKIEESDMGKVEVAVVQMDNMTEPGGLKRDLRLRHMVMIAISGTIGTGLFLTSGKTVATAGPLGARKCLLQLFLEADQMILFSC